MIVRFLRKIRLYLLRRNAKFLKRMKAKYKNRPALLFLILIELRNVNYKIAELERELGIRSLEL